ncbi:MAG: DUF1073 domain-containing protein [Gemmatimonadota bacterium]|nr:DUF1073 domain-containing protein [Gemmatimonadota bacterium]
MNLIPNRIRGAVIRARARRFLKQRQLSGPGTAAYGKFYGLNQGGPVNLVSGMGTQADKSEHAFFEPTRVSWRGDLEVIYAQSWACKKFIDIPIDDMMIRWRQFAAEAGSPDAGANEAAIEAMEAAEEEYNVVGKLGRAMKAGRLYGTGLLVMMTREAPLETPLNPDQIREGDLVALQVFDRFDASVMVRDDDHMSPTYGQALVYRINPARGFGFNVHASRVLRFDGITPLSDDGYTLYERDWGISEVVPAILAIMQDQSVATAVAHLATEASIPVIKVANLRDALAAAENDNEASAEKIGQDINMYKSVFRLLMMDAGNEEFERVSVNFGGIKDVQEQFARRLAAAAGIPATRFWSQSPVGMNATGESDMVNYAQHVAAMQNRLLTDPLMRLDEVLARNAGIGDAPEYEWLPLTDMSEVDQATIAKNKAEAMMAAVNSGVIDEDDAREALDGDAVFGTLEGMAPGLPEPDPPPGGPPGDPPSGGGGGE